MPEILDDWTVAQAWEHTYGSRPRPQWQDMDEAKLCELDAVVASYFDDESLEGRKRGAAAMMYLEPRLVRSQLPPGPRKRERQHVSEIVIRSLTRHCKRLGLPGPCYSHAIRCLRSWWLERLDEDDWHLIWDSLGISGDNVTDQSIWDFYKFAGAQVRYSSWS